MIDDSGSCPVTQLNPPPSVCVDDELERKKVGISRLGIESTPPVFATHLSDDTSPRRCHYADRSGAGLYAM